MTSDILVDIAGRLLGSPQTWDWALSRPVEYAFGVAFVAPVGRLLPAHPRRKRSGLRPLKR